MKNSQRLEPFSVLTVDELVSRGAVCEWPNPLASARGRRPPAISATIEDRRRAWAALREPSSDRPDLPVPAPRRPDPPCRGFWKVIPNYKYQHDRLVSFDGRWIIAGGGDRPYALIDTRSGYRRVFMRLRDAKAVAEDLYAQETPP